MKYYSKASFLLLFSLLLFFTNDVMSVIKWNPSDGYHNYQSLTDAISRLAKENSKITKFESIGKSYEGRDLWMIQISGTNGKSPLEKQALLIVGNLEGDHVIGSEVALGIAEYLVQGYGKNDEVTQILDERTFYIIPRLNPDGAEFFFQKLLKEHPKNVKPRDEDYDWKVDEDLPDDLNSDGFITVMRVKDKEGDWLIDKDDPRLMCKKEKETPLDSLYKVYPEGIDDDGDERYNEDGKGGFDIDRNFPHNFGYNIKGYGVYPVSENETRALIDFMNRYSPELETQPHKNICGALIFSKYDNLAATPGIQCGKPFFPEFKEDDSAMGQMSFQFGRRGRGNDRPEGKAKDPQPQKNDDRDGLFFQTVSDKYKEITGIKESVSEKPVGSMLEWAYFQYGIPAFSANLWSLRKEDNAKKDSTKQSPDAQKDESRDQSKNKMMMKKGMGGKAPGNSNEKGKDANEDKKWLEWIDKHNNGVGFVDWQKFQHKQLGEVEIGGFLPYLKTNPPASQIDSLSKSHAKFALYLASQFAEIKMNEPEVKKLSSNLFELKVKIKNDGQLPYITAMGGRTRNMTPILIQLKFEDDEKMNLFGGSKRVDVSSLDPGEEEEFKWVIISPQGKNVDITLWARHGGGKFVKKVGLK